jgi:hypothetical protein
MITQLARHGVLTVGAVGVCVGLARAASAQDAKRVEVQPFDQLAVASSIEEVFGGQYDLGKGIAELVKKRLVALKAVAAEDGQFDGRVEGTIIYFGKESGRGEAAGVSVGGMRVGLGRKREVALVMLEARLIDAASGQIVTLVAGQGTSDKGGWDVAAKTRGGFDLATVDLSGETFRKSAIGEATHKGVDELAKGMTGAMRELGTISVDAPVVAPTGPVMTGAMAMGGVGWVPYMFKGTEHFRYDVKQTDSREAKTGSYQLSLQPAGENRVRMAVAGSLGDDAYSSTVTTGIGPDAMQMGMNQFMALGPIGVTLFNPFAWMMFAGRELTLGDGWSYTGDGASVSVQVERECSHGGQSGLAVVVRQNSALVQEACVAKDVALPLRVFIQSDDETAIEMTLVEYRP